MVKYFHKNNFFLWIPRVVFVGISLVCLGYYLHYVSSILAFPFDWEPTDGDHLNFAHRIYQGLPIYLSLQKGEALSIYNPLYHSIVAFFGGANSSLSFARSISFLFWTLCPLILIFYYRKKWGIFYVLMASLFMWLPPEQGMLIDIVHVSPNTAMAFLFFASLLFADHCSENMNSGRLKWILLGIITGLCFLTKQQGLIAFASVMAFLLTKPHRLQNLSLVGIGFLILVFGVGFYLQRTNSGEFLNATLLDLNKLMIPDRWLAFNRLVRFFNFQFYFIAAAFVSFIAIGFIPTKLSIWQTSFLIHIPFLLLILGNAGGGQNYFLTFWIVTVVICTEILRQLSQSKIKLAFKYSVWFAALGILPLVGIISIGSRGQFLAFWISGLFCLIFAESNKSPILSWRNILPKMTNEFKESFKFSNIMMICLFANATVGASRNYDDLKQINLPTDELRQLMQTYYEAVGKLLEGKTNVKVLTARNIGGLVAGHADIRNEGSTMFGYAWLVPKIFPKEPILSAVNSKSYDIITTGIQSYPSDVLQAINQNYKIAFSGRTNLILGVIGVTTIYVPK